jgi:hypothetical protein
MIRLYLPPVNSSNDVTDVLTSGSNSDTGSSTFESTTPNITARISFFKEALGLGDLFMCWFNLGFVAEHKQHPKVLQKASVATCVERIPEWFAPLRKYGLFEPTFFYIPQNLLV